jgi:hypothetical protein
MILLKYLILFLAYLGLGFGYLPGLRRKKEEGRGKREEGSEEGRGEITNC